MGARKSSPTSRVRRLAQRPRRTPPRALRRWVGRTPKRKPSSATWRLYAPNCAIPRRRVRRRRRNAQNRSANGRGWRMRWRRQRRKLSGSMANAGVCRARPERPRWRLQTRRTRRPSRRSLRQQKSRHGALSRLLRRLPKPSPARCARWCCPRCPKPATQRGKAHGSAVRRFSMRCWRRTGRRANSNGGVRS